MNDMWLQFGNVCQRLKEHLTECKGVSLEVFLWYASVIEKLMVEDSFC